MHAWLWPVEELSSKQSLDNKNKCMGCHCQLQKSSEGQKTLNKRLSLDTLWIILNRTCCEIYQLSNCVFVFEKVHLVLFLLLIISFEPLTNLSSTVLRPNLLPEELWKWNDTKVFLGRDFSKVKWNHASSEHFHYAPFIFRLETLFGSLPDLKIESMLQHIRLWSLPNKASQSTSAPFC